MSKYVLFIAGVFDISLRGSEARDGHAVRRAGNVIQTYLVAELDGRRVAAVFAADSAVEIFAFALAELDRSFHKLADAYRIQAGERVAFINLARIVRRQEFARVVAREAESHLR